METEDASGRVVHARRRATVDDCPCCGRRLPLTFHHLIPRKLHRRRHFRKHYSSRVLARGVYVCRDCHDAIHRTYSEMELARDFATVSALLEDAALRKHFDWLARQRRASHY